MTTTVGAEVTPTGVLVYDGEPHTPGWFAARRQGITGTDLPKILGLTTYGNALTVWRDKRGEATDDAGEAAYWGTKQEPIVADRWAELNQTTVKRVGVIAHSNELWMRASLDRLVGECPDSDSTFCGLEIKTRNAYVAGKWRDDVPDDALAQVQWGLMTTGLDHMHVACLIGGQRLQSYRVDRDDELEGYLLRAATTVWEAVTDGVPPNVEADAGGVLLRELDRMFADRQGAVNVDADKAERLIELYAEGHRLERKGKTAKVLAKTGMVELLGGAEVALGNEDEPLWTYKRPEPTHEMTAEAVRKLEQKAPWTYKTLVAQGYITKTDPKPRFNLK